MYKRQVELMRRGIREALFYANQRGFKYVVIVAPRELREGKVVLKYMLEGRQEAVPINQLVEKLTSNLKSL